MEKWIKIKIWFSGLEEHQNQIYLLFPRRLRVLLCKPFSSFLQISVYLPCGTACGYWQSIDWFLPYLSCWFPTVWPYWKRQVEIYTTERPTSGISHFAQEVYHSSFALQEAELISLMQGCFFFLFILWWKATRMINLDNPNNSRVRNCYGFGSIWIWLPVYYLFFYLLCLLFIIFELECLLFLLKKLSHGKHATSSWYILCWHSSGLPKGNA